MAVAMNTELRALRDAGHEPEVFVLSTQAPGVLEHAGVRVERVRRADRQPLLRGAGAEMVQGYVVSPPLGVHELFAWTRAQPKPV